MTFEIGDRPIGPDNPTYIIAEMSANHLQDRERATELVRAGAEAGADAIKVQTFRPDTITLDSRKEPFIVQGGSPWDGESLYDLYEEAYMPWDWQPELKDLAEDLGLQFFSTADDETAVDFLEKMDVPAYKLASFEIVDIPLVRKIAATGRPIIMSTGMATLSEIDEAVRAAREEGAEDIALLQCTSSYPAPSEEMNLANIPLLSETFQVTAGLSDHTLDIVAPVVAVGLGASIVEKHLTLSRDDGGPDASFSLEPSEFERMVAAVRKAESSVGEPTFGPSDAESSNRNLRPSLWVTEPVEPGEVLTRDNVDTLRPADGLHPRHLDDVLGRTIETSLDAATPLTWELLS